VKGNQKGKQFTPAAVFHPAAILREEIRERKWSNRDLAEAIGRPLAYVEKLLAGEAKLLGAEACNLEKATGISAQFWITTQMLWNRATPEQRAAGGIRA
jgi:plasmid maintenance system antidote protein VapI